MQEAYSHFDPERQKARGKTMVKMRVVNRDTRHLPLDNGQVPEPGVSTITVYEDQVANVLAQVEPEPEAVKKAAELYEIRLVEQVQSQLSATWKSIDAVDLLAKLRAGTVSDPNVVDLWNRQRRITALSVHGVFAEANRRSMRPLVSAEVLEDKITEPQKIASDMERDRLAEAQAKALGVAFAPLVEKMDQALKAASGGGGQRR